MKVQELIQELSRYNPEADIQVVVDDCSETFFIVTWDQEKCEEPIHSSRKEADSVCFNVMK